MKCAIYCRVSTEDQNPEHQENALLEYAKNNDYDVFKVYTDITSGSKQSRPALNDFHDNGSIYKMFDNINTFMIDLEENTVDRGE